MPENIRLLETSPKLADLSELCTVCIASVCVCACVCVCVCVCVETRNMCERETE